MKLSNTLNILSIQMLILLSSIVLLSSISLILNFKIDGLFFIAGILLSLIYGNIVISSTFKKDKINYLKIAIYNVFYLLILYIPLIVSDNFYDISHDGQMYHQEAIIQLQQGWNPIYDKDLEENLDNKKANEIHISKINPNFWINHYAKGNWLLSSVIYDLTGKIEQSKVGNIYFLIISFLLTMSLLLKLSLNKFYSIWFALLAAFNPIVITQLFTFYIDGQLASLFLILLVLLIMNYIEYNNKFVVAIGLTIIMFINIKFTALGYALILCTIPFIADLYLNNRNLNMKLMGNFKLKFNKKLFYFLSSSFLIGIIIVGSNSYVKNTINHGNPMYPLAGEERVDIMTHTTPNSFKEATWIEKLYLSIFSETSNSTTEKLKTKFPISITDEEKSLLWVMDIRVGGFGPLFGAIVILSIFGILIWRKILFGLKGKLFLIVSIFVFFTVLINPELWWARYVPQLWLLPLFYLMFLALSKKNKRKMFYIHFVSVIISINIFLFIKASYDMNFQLTKELNLQLEVLKEYTINNQLSVSFNSMNSNRVRLEENNINYSSNEDIEGCVNPFNLIYSNTSYCIEDIDKYTTLYQKEMN